MACDDRIGVRLSAALRRRIDQAGTPSAAVRALLFVGLHAAGEDLTPYQGEAAALLPRIGDPAIRAALLRALFNIGSTHVQPMLNNAPPLPERGMPAEGDLGAGLLDELLGVGIEV